MSARRRSYGWSKRRAFFNQKSKNQKKKDMQLVTPELGLLFWMLVSFGIVFFILKKFAWKPILHMLYEREESIDAALKEAEKAREEMSKLQAKNERILDEARVEREKIFREAQEMKEKIVGEAREQAIREKDKIMGEARASIEAEKMSAIREIRNTAAELSVMVAEKLLVRELSAEAKQKALVEQLIREIPVN
jgi:F-type H+-transporting ATPase subunit b